MLRNVLRWLTYQLTGPSAPAVGATTARIEVITAAGNRKLERLIEALS